MSASKKTMSKVPKKYEDISKETQNIGVEMILRRSFKASLKEYTNNCTLAGAKMMFNPDIDHFQRVFWIAMFCASLGAVCYFLKYIWVDSLSKPLIVTLDSTDYPIEKIDFPAVAICNINRISKKALEELAVKEFPDLATSKYQTLEEVQRVLINLGRLLDLSYNDSLRYDPMYIKLVDKYRIDNQKITSVMKMLAPSCEDVVTVCAWAGDLIDCAEVFQLRRAGRRGHCCTFNYLLDFYNHAELRKRDTVLRHQSVPGWLYGLTFMLDPMLEDYVYPLAAVQGFEILVFDPMKFPDTNAGQVTQRISEPDTALFLELKSKKQIASPEVRKYNINTRKCLFHNEMKAQFGNMYSYSTCIVFCALAAIQSLCKCIPYFYAPDAKYRDLPVCSLEDLKCLNKYEDKLVYLYPFDAEDLSGLEEEVKDSLSCDSCLPDCELTEHRISGYKTPLNEKIFSKVINDVITTSSNASGKSIVSVYFPTPDANLVRLDVVYQWYEILSSFGGFCGIFIGLSVSSVIEIIYFFTIRFIQHCAANFRIHK